jgi:chromosome segregation ATPase
VWEFVRANPGEAIGLLSLILTAIGGLAGGVAAFVKWLMGQSERRLDFKIKALAQGQTEQSERLENAIKLADMLYETIEEQLKRARETENSLRDRLMQQEAENAAQDQALREAQAMVLELEYDLKSCQKQNAAQLKVIEESEAAHAEMLAKYLEQKRQIERLQQEVRDVTRILHDQSWRHETDRHRLAAYDARQYEEDDTRPLGQATAAHEEPQNGTDTDTPEH